MLRNSSRSVLYPPFECSTTMYIGQTDTTSVKCLINSISRFIHLVSCQRMKLVPYQKICNNMVGVLKRLKPVLDDIMDYKIPLDDNLCKECEELDARVNEARAFIEKWGPKSKIHSVLQSGTLLIKIQNSSLDICHMIVRPLKSPPSASVLANLQHYIEEVQCLKREMAMVHIEEALKNQRDNIEPCKEHLKEIIELLKLKSKQELFTERIAVEKIRLNAEADKMIGDMEEINEIVNLACNLCDYVMETEPVVRNGVAIPPYFCCPLSLEFMSEPVIVASGQTYERKSIKTWLDHGLTVCPKTHKKLAHINLIPNYTFKAMIASWCEANNVKLSSNFEDIKSAHITPSLNDLQPPPDFTNDFSVWSLSSSNSVSRSSLQTEKGDNSFRLCGEYNGCQRGATEKCEKQSPYVHSRSVSCSSSISSTDLALAVSKDVSGISNNHQNVKVLSGEITNACHSPGNEQSGISSSFSGKQFQNSGSNVGQMENGNTNNHNTNNSLSRVDSRSVFNSGSAESTTSSHVNKLIEDLHSHSIELQTTAAEELRLLTKNNMENRIIVGQCGAVLPLLSLLYSEVKITQEHAVTAVLNLSINEHNKALIMEAGAIEPLITVLKTGNDAAKENSAATLFSLSVIESNKAKIGRSGAVKALVDLLASGTLRGKKDAATALFNLSIFHENKARIVQAGAVKFLVRLMESTDGMVDKAVALLSNLSTIPGGQLDIAREGGIPVLVEIIESGSQRGKENAASILLQLCLHSSKFCALVLQEGAVPPLVALSQSGTPRAKEKAQQLLSHFRNQREGAIGKGKS